MSTSVGLTNMPFEWRGRFKLVHDCQSVDAYLSCLGFELEIKGEWYPVDWNRFRRKHPESAAKIAAEVKSKL